MASSSFVNRRRVPVPILFALAGGMLAILFTGLSSWRALSEQQAASATLSEVTAVAHRLDRHQALLLRAEADQRGFLLSGDDAHRRAFEASAQAVEGEMALLTSSRWSAAQQHRADELQRLTRQRLDQLRLTMDRRKSGALAVGDPLPGAIDEGRVVMEQVRAVLLAMQQEQSDAVARESAAVDTARSETRSTLAFGCAVLLALFAAAAMLLVRDSLQRNRETWLRDGEAGVATALLGDKRADELGRAVIDFLATYTGAAVGAFYSGSSTSTLVLRGSHSLTSSHRIARIVVGDGVVGQVVVDRRARLIEGIAATHLAVQTGTGMSSPTSLLLMPTQIDDEVNGVIELGFVTALHGAELELLERVAAAIGVGIKMAEYREQIGEQLSDSQAQAEQLQQQAARLEEQQNTLEAANTRLQAQTSTLAAQQQELGVAADVLVEKNAELERSSQYKSSFLANMSHELRTPLNSSLLLARLLVENKEGNLTAEQIKFAETIYEAGSDLLALINDVLDVSKIEAGRVDIRPQPVSIVALSDSMRRLFAPVAEDKGLAFSVDIDPALIADDGNDVAASFVTDLQRLEQILKNLLSNAFKFTREGQITLRIGRGTDRSLRFVVVDTGVGIAADKHELVFEAFRQVDDGFARAHGGTGLGLSISRELARLLGGELTLVSHEGQGSTFTLTLPLAHRRTPTEELLQPVAPLPLKTLPTSSRTLPSLASPARGSSAPPLPPPRAQRSSSSSSSEASSSEPAASSERRRRVLIVDDDPQFSTLLVRVVKGAGHEPIVAETADDAVELTRHHLPDGVLLDLHLPDHSGLSVLDRLKRDLRTRHIPVHIVTGTDDDPRRAMAMGAVGFTTKPLSVETIKLAIDGMFTRHQKTRHVLVIEGDRTQRDVVVGLLQHDTVAVQTAASSDAARAALNAQHFDCIVMDIAFPDGAKQELLQSMATTPNVVLPPVIVYTAAAPTDVDEERLLRVANTLVVKFARSPEQLIDEVTLFLHQAESELPPERQRMLRTSRDRDQVFEGRTLLIVEDDVRNVYALSRVLEPRGAKVEIARNGVEALQRLEANRSIDLVLMDVMMPEMDGIEATKRIRADKEQAGLPIIALTAKVSSDDQRNCMAAGANDFLPKPIDVDKLVSLIRVWLPREPRRRR